MNESSNLSNEKKRDRSKSLRFKRTCGDDPSFLDLVNELDQNLDAIYNNISYPYDMSLSVDDIPTAVLASINNISIGGGCFKALDEEVAEVKRLFVNPYFRGMGIASGILEEIIDWSHELKFSKLVLETGQLQTESIKLFEKHGFYRIENFGPYKGIAGSICMEKRLMTNDTQDTGRD